MSDNLRLRSAQALGLTTSSILTGYVASASIQLIPRILESPTPLMLRQWAAAYHSGKKAAPPIAILSSACYFYLSYILPSSASKSKFWGYVVAGSLTVGILPYTILLMMGTNRKLLVKAEEARGLGFADEVVEGLGGETAHKLVDDWGLLNLGRAVILGVGAVVGAWTALGGLDEGI